jgi:hypothetical protein
MLPVGILDRNPADWSTLTALTTAHTVSAAHHGPWLV